MSYLEHWTWLSCSPMLLACFSGTGDSKDQVPVVQNVDNSIYRINHYPVDSVVCLLILRIHWIAIYPLDSVIKPANSWGQFVTL